jgi:hypothetical protein
MFKKLYAGVYLPVLAGYQTKEQGPHIELAWLKKEYHLSDSQSVRVVDLHDAYWPKWAGLCRRIDEQNAKVQRLLLYWLRQGPEMKQALAEAASFVSNASHPGCNTFMRLPTRPGRFTIPRCRLQVEALEMASSVTARPLSRACFD